MNISIKRFQNVIFQETATESLKNDSSNEAVDDAAEASSSTSSTSSSVDKRADRLKKLKELHLRRVLLSIFRSFIDFSVWCVMKLIYNLDVKVKVYILVNW